MKKILLLFSLLTIRIVLFAQTTKITTSKVASYPANAKDFPTEWTSQVHHIYIKKGEFAISNNGRLNHFSITDFRISPDSTLLAYELGTRTSESGMALVYLKKDGSVVVVLHFGDENNALWYYASPGNINEISD